MADWVYGNAASVDEAAWSGPADDTSGLPVLSEWGVKVYAEDPPPRPPRHEDALSGAEDLMMRHAELAESENRRREAAAEAQEVHEALRHVAMATLLRGVREHAAAQPDAPMLLNGSYLVGDDDEAAFMTALKQMAGIHLEIRIELTGPWPPYSFAGPDGGNRTP